MISVKVEVALNHVFWGLLLVIFFEKIEEESNQKTFVIQAPDHLRSSRFNQTELPRGGGAFYHCPAVVEPPKQLVFDSFMVETKKFFQPLPDGQGGLGIAHHELHSARAVGEAKNRPC